MRIKVMKQTHRTTGDNVYLVDQAVSSQIGLWSTDLRFAQICDSEVYDPWEFENDDRRAKKPDYTYELVELETEVYYLITDPRGWVVVDEKPGAHSLQIHIVYSKKLASIIEGSEYENIRKHFDILGWEQHQKTRVFPHR